MQKIYLYFCGSFILHVSIASLLFINFNFFAKQNSLLDTKNNVLKTYIYQNIKFIKNKDIFPKKQNVNFKQQKNNQVNTATNTIFATNKNSINNLNSILHDLIQEKIDVYKDVFGSIKANVTVQFDLYPDGSIENLQFISKDKNHFIEEIIKNAIAAIQPITIAKKYLSQKEQFEVTVIFGV